MATPPLSEDQLREALKYYEAAVAAGYRSSGIPSAKEEAARRMVADGIVATVSTAGARVKRALDMSPPPPEPERPSAPIEITPRDVNPREVADAAFWRRKAKEAETEAVRLQRVLDEVTGVLRAPVEPPAWLVSQSTARHRAVMACLLTDWHVGEVVRADEVDGINAYDLDVFRRRFRRYVDAVCKVGPRWMSDCEPAGCLVALGGDLISGNIHAELRETNELTAIEQVQVAVAETVVGLGHLVDTFGRVHVVSVPGNHGRATEKPQAKRAVALSYDTLVALMARDRVSDDRVSWQIEADVDAYVPVLGWTVLVTHGDRLGTGGGQGFAGPFLPIARGAKKVQAQAASALRHYDILMHGHYHTSGQLGWHLSNGSLIGFGEYAKAIRAPVEPPQQWAAVIHERWGLRDRSEIKLEDPRPPMKPRVRVPWGVAA